MWVVISRTMHDQREVYEQFSIAWKSRFLWWTQYSASAFVTCLSYEEAKRHADFINKPQPPKPTIWKEVTYGCHTQHGSGG